MNTNKTILVVDDDEHTLSLMEEILTLQGYRVCLANTGRQALEAYHQQRPDIVLLDRDLPEMDGPAVVEAICAVDPEARIIILSGYSPDDIGGIDDNTRQHISGYLVKPFGLKKLRDLLSGEPGSVR